MKKKLDSARRRLLLECAELYYLKNYRKNEIANKLNVSPTHVSRLLIEAESAGLVQIEVRLADRHRSLESALVKKYSLKMARVVDYEKEYDLQKENLGKAAAAILDEISVQRTRLKVGIGGGGTLQAMVKALGEKPRSLEIYPLALFGRGPVVEFVASPFLATYLLIKNMPTATAKIVSLPPLPADQELAKKMAPLLFQLPAVREVIEGARSVDLAFVGLGAFIDAQDIFREYDNLGFSPDHFVNKKTKGGINYNYFDGHGSQVGGGLAVLSIDELRTMTADPRKITVLVAGGFYKFEAIKIALETVMVNSIVTDEYVAENLLSQ